MPDALPWIGPAVLFALGLTVFCVWRLSNRRRLRRCARGLQSFERAERARAGEDIAELGLRRGANTLLDHIADEDDARVRLTIALAVAGRQQKRAGPRRVREVRAWAAEELVAHGYDAAELAPAATDGEPISDGDPAAEPPPISWRPPGRSARAGASRPS
jgi:hypothetical protein